jgi:DNA phosphorothioation-dependent restriction protein DptG
MKIDINAYNNHYHQSGKFIDKFQEGIKLIPFDSRNASAFDKNCSLQGTTGEFFRLWANDGTKSIESFSESAETPVKDYLVNSRQMASLQASEFVRMMKDIMVVNGNLNVTNTNFLKYLPLVPNDERISTRERSMYKDGQKKLSNYVYSMLSLDVDFTSTRTSKDLFTKILEEALSSSVGHQEKRTEGEYYIINYIRDSFNEDFTWLMSQEETVKVKYLHLFFYFYACYSVTQAIVNINSKSENVTTSPKPFFFILSNEKASINHDAITRGWTHIIPTKSLDRLYGKSQALDIINCILGNNIGFYSDVIHKLNETSFDDNKDSCVELIELYQAEKRKVLEARNSERYILDSFGEIDTEVNSYEDFYNKLEKLCIGLQSPSYTSRMRKKVIDLLSVRFLQNRKRSGYVLTLDNEMLTFLIALFTKSKKTKLEDMYRFFNSYGIYFNRGSRIAIEEYLLKLNLLDRKSDSGEAQYVTVIL